MLYCTLNKEESTFSHRVLFTSGCCYPLSPKEDKENSEGRVDLINKICSTLGKQDELDTSFLTQLAGLNYFKKV